MFSATSSSCSAEQKPTQATAGKTHISRITDWKPYRYGHKVRAIMAAPTVFSSFPKIGIRPAIDGRYGGVRESLEDQTMEMARSAAALISSTLRYPDGSPVECVISDTCIGGVAEASACAEKFARENVGV